ncbi:hypothetical protein ES708_27626 [subsurface metagenome]
MKYYSNLIDVDGSYKEGFLCKGRGWQSYLEPNPDCDIVYSPDQKPANEVVIFAQSENRAQYIANLVMASYCLYSGEVITTDVIRVSQERPATPSQLKLELLRGGGRRVGFSNLPVSCLIAAKACERLAYQYAIFKYLLSCHTVILPPRDLDPQGDWEPGKAVSVLPEDHVYFTNAIFEAYSVLEELSIEMRASKRQPSKIQGQWNTVILENLQARLLQSGVNPSDRILWHLRDTPTRIERSRKPIVADKTEWAAGKVRDSYIDLPEAIAYASWLRSQVSAHRLRKLTRSLTIYDVANVQHLARYLLLKALGFWRFFERPPTQD